MKKANYEYKDIEKAMSKQKERYKKRLESMIKSDLYNCYFLTFTFNEKTMSNTSQKTRIRYLKAYLNKQAKDYLINADYGETNGREHYHAIIISRYKVIVADEWTKYGFMKIKKIHSTIYNAKTQSAEELTKHAFKDSTHGFKIIYSRQSKKRCRAFEIKANRKLKEYRKSDKGKANKRLYKSKLIA